MQQATSIRTAAEKDALFFTSVLAEDFFSETLLLVIFFVIYGNLHGFCRSKISVRTRRPDNS